MCVINEIIYQVHQERSQSVKLFPNLTHSVDQYKLSHENKYKGYFYWITLQLCCQKDEVSTRLNLFWVPFFTNRFQKIYLSTRGKCLQESNQLVYLLLIFMTNALMKISSYSNRFRVNWSWDNLYPLLKKVCVQKKLPGLLNLKSVGISRILVTR